MCVVQLDQGRERNEKSTEEFRIRYKWQFKDASFSKIYWSIENQIKSTSRLLNFTSNSRESPLTKPLYKS